YRPDDQRDVRSTHRLRAVGGRRPDVGGQHPHRARARILRGTPRGRCRHGRRRAPGRLLADDRGDRRLTTIPMSLSPSLPNLFSHSAGLALIAIATASDVGVELEYIRGRWKRPHGPAPTAE